MDERSGARPRNEADEHDELPPRKVDVSAGVARVLRRSARRRGKSRERTGSAPPDAPTLRTRLLTDVDDRSVDQPRNKEDELPPRKVDVSAGVARAVRRKPRRRGKSRERTGSAPPDAPTPRTRLLTDVDDLSVDQPRNEEDPLTPHQHAVPQQKIDLSKLFSSENEDFGFSNLQTNTKNTTQQSDDNCSIADEEYYSEEDGGAFSVMSEDAVDDDDAWKREGDDNDIEGEEDGGTTGEHDVADMTTIAEGNPTHDSAVGGASVAENAAHDAAAKGALPKGRSEAHLVIAAKKVVHLTASSA